jgi:hypothetical protein
MLDLMCDGAGMIHGNLLVFSKLIFVREMGKDITLEDKERGLKEMEIFRNWFQENVFGSNADTASDAVMIMPNGRAVPKYRDDHNG